MINQDIAVKVENLTKSFRIPLEASSGLKQKLINALKGRKGYRDFTPLNDVSFEIKKGEFFGIVGRNGSGKSTLLKTIAGIYAPTNGLAHVNGTLVPFIELGVGFNPELTGRENVFLNGALLGFSHIEMEAMYDDIIDFAEIGEFMDEKLKNYSSGMQVRLAFSIAIRANGDILLLDEVLAVGDEAFQRKCNDYFSNLRENGKTVILVTHNMDAVKRYCTRALLLNNGKIEHIGEPGQVADVYTSQNDDRYLKGKNKSYMSADDSKKEFTLEINNGGSGAIKDFLAGEVVDVAARWTQEGVMHIGIALLDQQGRDIFSPSLDLKGESKEVNYSFTANLAPGAYHLRAVIFTKKGGNAVGKVMDGPQFFVRKAKNDIDYIGVTQLEHEWHPKTQS